MGALGAQEPTARPWFLLSAHPQDGSARILPRASVPNAAAVCTCRVSAGSKKESAMAAGHVPRETPSTTPLEAGQRCSRSTTMSRLAASATRGHRRGGPAERRPADALHLCDGFTWNRAPWGFPRHHRYHVSPSPPHVYSKPTRSKRSVPVHPRSDIGPASSHHQRRDPPSTTEK
jgi:hypothetical protein